MEKNSGRKIWLVFLLVVFAFTKSHWPQSRPMENLLKTINQVKYRFQLDLSWGIKKVRAGDLNSRINYDQRVDSIVFGIRGLSNEGKLKPLSSAMLAGARLRYNLTRSLALSLGYKQVWKTQTSPSYLMHFGYVQYRDRPVNVSGLSSNYQDYTLYIKSHIPTLGFHALKQMNKKLSVEGFIGVGPVFASCGFSHVHQQFYQTSYFNMTSQIDTSQKGKGTGFSLEWSVRLSMSWTKKSGIFFSAGYSWIYVKNISGPGLASINTNYLYRNQSTSSTTNRYTWHDTWEMVVTDSYINFPSAGWEASNIHKVTRNFRLNLAGYEVRIGTFLRF